MIFPGGKIDYKAITNSFIENKAFSSMIWENMDFVEKYLPEVKKAFKDENERKIVYRQLAVIIHSCIEAVMKSVLINVDEHCKKRECNETCPYRLLINSPSTPNYKKSSIFIFYHLLNTRLIWFFPREINEFGILNDLRNNVHISKSIGKNEPDTDFDVELVTRMRSYFYGLLAQLSFKSQFFEDYSICLKIMDNNRMEKTKSENVAETKKSYYFQVSAALYLLFCGGEIYRNEKWVLNKLHKNFDSKDIGYSIYYIFAFNSYRFQSTEEYQKSLNEYFEKLSKYINEDYLNKVRNSYNEIKKQTENKQ